MSLRRFLILCLCLIAPALGIAPAGAWAADPVAVADPVVTLQSPGSLWLGQTVTLRVTVAPALPGGLVTVEDYVGGAWVSVPGASGPLDEASQFTVKWRPETYGYIHLRARLAPGADYAGGVSATRRVVVNRPNRHHVLYRYPHYIVIVVHEYRLYYYEHGALRRSFNVALGRPGYPTPLGHFWIWGKIRPAGGAMGSCAMYYHHNIAIHGTNQPYLLNDPLPRNYSHGCARMYNSMALWLYARCPLGTPVHNIR